MTPAPRDLPSRDDELLLHGRLVAADPTATADLAEQYLAPLIEWLVGHNDRHVSKELFEEAASEALVSLMKRPQSFRPERSSGARPLFSYLCMSAQRDFQNILLRERRHTEGRRSLDSVEHSPDAWKYLGRDDDPALTLVIHEELTQGDQNILAPALDGLSDEEQQALRLMLDGERKTDVFARVLRLDHLPKPEREREVKRVKDKLKKRIERGRTDHA